MGPSIDAAIQQFTPGLPLAVALSGGADSTALLLACVRRWPEQVVAVHVNHGLQHAAGTFEAHCQAVCARLNMPLTVAHVHARAAPGQSPEDAARIARYQALDRLADAKHRGKPIASVALGQHADDQAETVLLALGRGAGLAGLSAMPAEWVRKGLTFYRPLLAVSAADIRRWLAERGEGFIEDPSNADEAFLRNRIRARLMPALREVFPHYAQTLPRSAGHAAQGQALLTEIAAEDWLRVCDECGRAPRIKCLQDLGAARQANVLRHWLVQQCDTQASSAQVRELMRQISACTTRGHRIEIRVGNGFVQRSNEVLAWYNLPV